MDAAMLDYARKLLNQPREDLLRRSIGDAAALVLAIGTPCAIVGYGLRRWGPSYQLVAFLTLVALPGYIIGLALGSAVDRVAPRAAQLAVYRAGQISLLLAGPGVVAFCIFALSTVPLSWWSIAFYGSIAIFFAALALSQLAPFRKMARGLLARLPGRPERDSRRT
jgi:hypothetical protein